MEIYWNIDKETTLDQIEPDDLLGDIKISDNKNIIIDSNVYLDNWFDSLIDGLVSLKKGVDLESDLISEPDPLIFEKNKNGYTISYKSQSININNLDNFETSLLQACKELISIIDENVPDKNKESLTKIEKFMKR